VASLNYEQGILAWQFLAEDGRTEAGKGIAMHAGETWAAGGPATPADWECSGSVRALDALQYASGPMACRVVLWGEVTQTPFEIFATKCTCLWLADASYVLHEFALRIASSYLRQMQNTGHQIDPLCWTALDVKKGWLHGQATDTRVQQASLAVQELVRDETKRVVQAATNFDAARTAYWTIYEVSALSGWREATATARTIAQAAGESEIELVRAWAQGWSDGWRDGVTGAREAFNAQLSAALERLEP
jgi:hypothetical protein